MRSPHSIVRWADRIVRKIGKSSGETVLAPKLADSRKSGVWLGKIDRTDEQLVQEHKMKLCMREKYDDSHGNSWYRSEPIRALFPPPEDPSETVKCR